MVSRPQNTIVGNVHRALTEISVRHVIDIEVLIILTTSSFLDAMGLVATVHSCIFIQYYIRVCDLGETPVKLINQKKLSPL